MPAQRHPLPEREFGNAVHINMALTSVIEDIEQHETDKSKVRCQICLAFTPLPDELTWISSHSLSGHLKGKKHSKNLERFEFEQIQRAREVEVTAASHHLEIPAHAVHKENCADSDPNSMAWDASPLDSMAVQAELDGFTAMRDVISHAQEQERMARELDDFVQYTEQVLLPHEPEPTEEGLSIPGNTVIGNYMGAYDGHMFSVTE